MQGRHAAESALLESEERYRAVIGALEEGIILYEADGAISGCNASACRILGLTEAEIVGRSARDPGWRGVREDGSPFEPESHPAAITLLTGLPCSHVIMGINRGVNRGSASRVWVSINSRPLCRPGSDDPYAVAVSMSDITRRKRFEAEQGRFQEALRKSAIEWRLTFDAITHPVMLLEIDGRIVRVNEAARELIGLTYEQMLHRPLAFLGDAEPWRATCVLLPQVEASGAAASIQVRDEQGRTWDLSLSPVTSPDGQSGVVAVARDLTDVVRLQDSLRRSETMSAMGALVAGVAHEVRNPLFGISATLDAFAARFKRRKEYRPYTDVLQGEVSRLSELMHQLLDYGKPFRLVVTPESPREVMEVALKVCQPLADQAQVELAVETAADLPLLPMDRNRMVQVFQNLLENAVQQSPAGSRVLFHAACAVRGESGESDGICFTVEDAGPGFRPDDLPQIFEPFFTRRRGGTGLGLAIVQRIVENHEGEILTANRAEGGAAISVILPIHQKVSTKVVRDGINGSEPPS